MHTLMSKHKIYGFFKRAFTLYEILYILHEETYFKDKCYNYCLSNDLRKTNLLLEQVGT